MTLIAFATYGDHAELVTDTMSYTTGGRDVAQCTKHLTLNHLDAVIATQGDSLFAIWGKTEIMLASCLTPTFDELASKVPETLRGAWEDLLRADATRGNLESSIYLIGYSTAAAKFVAYRFLREHNFDAEIVSDELHVTPSPLTMRPQQFEPNRLAAGGMPDAFAQQWLAQPEPAIPGDLGDWGVLALRVRYERAVPSNAGKAFVGGKVIHTRIERDLVQTITLTEYDDDGDEFTQMVAGTRHPSSQHGPCQCKSGKTMLECCALPYLDEPCGCGKLGSDDRTFRECCMAPPLDSSAD